MKKLTSYLLASAVLMLSHASFAQDTVKHAAKVQKKVTHKVTTHHKVVKKTAPTM